MTFDLKYLDQEPIAVLIALFIPLYALSLSRMDLPDYIRNLFNNTLFRIVFLALLLIFRFDKAPHVAFTVALIFVLTLDNISNKEVMENLTYLESLKQQKEKINYV